MRNVAMFIGIAALMLNVNVKASAPRSLSVSGGDELDNLRNGILVVVLLEESQKYEDKLTKAHKAPLIAAYKTNIQTINDNMQAVASKYLTITKSIEFKTMSEIVALPQATREGYSYLVYDRSTQFDKGSPTNFEFDFYASKDDERQAMLNDYLNFIQFDCADPKYHGEEDYRKLDIIVEGRKRSSEEIFTESLDQIIPTQGSFALCFMELQNQFATAMAGPKKVYKDDVRQQIATARTKKLLVCKDNMERNITDAKIQAVFKYRFSIVSRQDFDKAILSQDTSCCLLIVYPFNKVESGNKPTVNYQHLIINAETGDLLLTVVPEPGGGGMPGGYQKITDKHFKDIAREEDKVTK